MAFNHRKLFSQEDLSICTKFCDPAINTNGYCPTPCRSLCFLTCYSQFIPPPDDSPSTPISINHPNKTQKLRLILIISLSILATICFLISCYTIYKYYKNRRRRARSSIEQDEEVTHDDFLDEEHGPVFDHPIWYIRTVGLQPSIIEKITVLRYKRGDGLVEGTECSVCLSEFEEGETVRLLPKCNHAFHVPCIDTWLRSHTNCPMCRAGIVVNNPAPLPEQSVVVTEETEQVVVAEGSGEFGVERELRMETEEESELRVENRGKSTENSMEEGEDIVLQPIRRSVSMDSLSAAMISAAAIAYTNPGESDGNSNTQMRKVGESNMGIVPKKVDVNQSLIRLVGGSSVGRSTQNGPVFMKRSFSCSGKVSLTRHKPRRNSILPS